MIEEKPDESKGEYYLHYIGAKTYGIRRFLREADVKEAQRVIPFKIAKKIKYGDKILLAEHRKIEQIDQTTSQTLEPLKMAVCFGYLRIKSISHNLPDDISQEVLKRLHVDDFKDYGSSGGMTEVRACGSYGVGSVAYVQEDISEICTIIEKVCAEKGFNLSTKGIKFFIRGSVTKFEAPLSVENIEFTRGLYSKIKLDKTLVPDLDTFAKGSKGAVMQIYDYKLKACMTKKDQVSYDRALNDEYREATKEGDQ